MEKKSTWENHSDNPSAILPLFQYELWVHITTELSAGNKRSAAAQPPLGPCTGRLMTTHTAARQDKDEVALYCDVLFLNGLNQISLVFFCCFFCGSLDAFSRLLPQNYNLFKLPSVIFRVNCVCTCADSAQIMLNTVKIEITNKFWMLESVSAINSSI